METDEQALGQFWADPYSFTPPDGEPVEFSQRVLSDSWATFAAAVSPANGCC
jgi:hypothetical protein